MGRSKKTIADRARDYKAEKFYVSDTGILICGFCNMRLEWQKKDNLDKHCQSSAHKSKKKSAESDPQSSKRQSSLPEINESVKKAKQEKTEFVMDTVKTFLQANIPLHKLDNPAVREYLSKYVKGSDDLPGSDKLRRVYVEKCGDDEKERVRKEFEGQDIVIVADETTDSQGRCVFAILFRTLNSTSKQKVALASCSFLDKATGTTCSQAIVDTVRKYDVSHEHIVGVVSDSARYMNTCFSALKVLFGDHLIHFQCWAHKINLIGDVFMMELPELNRFIVNLKMAFLHGRKIKSSYVNFLVSEFPELPSVLFPKPVITRWNSWFKSVIYLDKYLEPLTQFLSRYEEKNASALLVCETLQTPELNMQIKTQITFISEICQPLMKLIDILEGSEYPCGHIIWDHLERISLSLERQAKGFFPEKTTLILLQCNNKVKQAKMTEKLKNACTKAHMKLLLHMGSCEANNVYRASGTLFNPVIAGQLVQVNEASVFANRSILPAFKAVEKTKFIEGYLYFHKQLLNQLKEGIQIDVLQIFLAMRPNFEEFCSAALKSLWLPVNSVDAERFFSSYNLVLTDRRTKLTENNLETCAMLKFNQ